MDFFTEDSAKILVENYLLKEHSSPKTQYILDSNIIPKLKGFYVRPGKVSDSIYGGIGSYLNSNKEEVNFENPCLRTKDGTKLRIMVRTERISTHDINRGEIPFKDQIIATNHNFMRKLVKDIIGTSQYDILGLEDNSVVIAAENIKTIMFENVLRAYMAKSTTSTSLYHAWLKGEKRFCGHQIPEKIIPNGKLPYVMDTPSTKSEIHDESVIPEVLFAKGICSPDKYAEIRNSSLVAWGEVSSYLLNRGIILVDTKTEHGINKKGNIVSQDELYTMDSSRYWLVNDYNQQLEKLANGEIKELNPNSFSKEFARGFSEGEKGYIEEQRIQIAVRYILGIQHLTGLPFEPDMRTREERIISGLEKIVINLVT